MSITCPACKGKKTTSMTVHTHDTKGVSSQTMDIKCIDCDGAGDMTSDQHTRYLRMKAVMADFWCKCDNPSERVTYHDDAPGAKHHWTCDDCGKVTQIG